MDYDVVIATRNRLEALKLSIPLILKQERPPHKLIIVDASDDYETVRETVIETVAKSTCNLKILHCKPNLPYQRNRGLEHVESPVVFLPDDDSFWWPGVGEAIMRVYERDNDGHIGGVCAVATPTPPPGVAMALKGGDGYKMRRYDFLIRKWGRIRFRIENRLFPDPYRIHGMDITNGKTAHTWLAEENCVVVPFMAGVCFSFRTNDIRRNGFCEELGDLMGWTGGEDAEACFHVMKRRLLVGNHNAKVCHYRFPSRRGDGFRIGFVMLFNHAYIICKHSKPGSRARKSLKHWALYKTFLYLFGINTRFGRARLRGAFLALKFMKDLQTCSSESLRENYLRLCEKVVSEKHWKE